MRKARRPSQLVVRPAATTVSVLTLLALSAPTWASGFPSPPAFDSDPPAPVAAADPAPPKPGQPRPRITGQQLAIASISPQTSTYGTGIIVTVRFDKPVPAALRPAVVKHLKVKSSKKLGTSGWAWRDAQTVLFRPKKFWPAHARIRISANPDYSVIGMVAKDSGSGQTQLRWAGTLDHRFQVGRSQVIYVDGRTTTAKVVRDGATVRTMGVSLGKPGWETRSGIKVLMDKYAVKRMTSGSIGAEEDYVLDVPYAIRLTDSGEFIHGAPWANARIGRWNGSHGCTNLFVSDAQWLYNTRLFGDPIITAGTNRQMTSDNGMGGPWNVSWSLWSAGRMS